MNYLTTHSCLWHHLIWPSVVSNYMCVTSTWFVSLLKVKSYCRLLWFSSEPSYMRFCGRNRSRSASGEDHTSCKRFSEPEDHTTCTINTRYTIRHTQKTHTLSRSHIYSLQDLRETRIHHHPQHAGDKPVLIHTSRWLVDVYEAKRQNFPFSPWQLN